MKKHLSPIVLFALALVLAGTAMAGQVPAGKVEGLAYDYFKEFPSDGNVVRAGKLFSMIGAGEAMFILDTRRPGDYGKNHLKGAVNLPFFDMSIPGNLERIPDDKPVLVYCYSGQTAAQVTVLLNIAGKKARNVQSGFNDAIAKVDGYEVFLEQADRALPEGPYAVDADVKKALIAYFKDKMDLDGTPFADFAVAPKTVKAIVDEKNDAYYILSIRRPSDHANGHIPMARNIAYGRGMEKRLVTLPRDKKIVVYCYSGQTSSQTIAVLRLMGYEAYSMTGGMTAWTKAGYPVSTDR